MDSVPDIRQTTSFEALQSRKITSAKPQSVSSDSPEIIARKQKMEEAAQGFESLFINMLLKQMRRTIPKSDFINGGYGEKIFEEMFDEEISKKIAQRGGLGIAHAIYTKFEQSIPVLELPDNHKEQNQ